MRVFILLPLVFLAACQGTSTIGPTVSQDELRLEQQYQRGYIKESDIKEYEEAPEITKAMEARFRQTALPVGVAGEDLCKDVGFKDCVFGFRLEEKKELNAYADGKDIVITSAMMMFASKPEELANVLSHEYAHNIMSHVAKTQQNATIGAVLGAAVDFGLSSQGMSGGGSFSQLGAQAGVLQYSVGFEREADYMGLYVLRRAGFDPNGALDFWRKMSVANEQAIDTAVTHPTNPERFVAMKKTIAEIDYKSKNRLPLVPEFKVE